MIQNNYTTNTEDGNVGNIPLSNGSRGDTVPKEKFLFKEPIVLMSIVGLTVFNSISWYLQPSGATEITHWMLTIHILSTSAAPVVGALFAAFLSEVIGRKPVYIYLFALSVFSFILLLSSNHAIVVCLIFILHGLISGGKSVMNAVAISEYSSPKHRFAWMVFDLAAINIMGRIKPFLNLNTDIVFYVLLVIQIVLGVIGLGSTWVWPESPYWLASKGKLEQSRMAFIWLRGNGGKEELASVLKARRRPGPPKLFWISLAIALATISVSIFSRLHVIQSYILSNDLIGETHELHYNIYLFSTAAFFSILAAVSYFIKRKLLFIVVCIISFILSYAEALWLYLASRSDLVDSVLFYLFYDASVIIQTCGPRIFGVILFIEIAPYKYNTVISCICFIFLFLSITVLLPLTSHHRYEKYFHPSALLASYTTFSLVAALLYYFFAPETKDKTLLEIQSSYTSTPNENDSNPEQNQSMMLNVI